MYNGARIKRGCGGKGSVLIFVVEKRLKYTKRSFLKKGCTNNNYMLLSDAAILRIITKWLYIFPKTESLLG